MRSRVNENCWPTTASVWSVFMPMPKRMRSTRSSRGVNDARTRVVVSRKFCEHWKRRDEIPKEFVTLPGKSYPNSALADACYTLLLAPKSAALK